MGLNWSVNECRQRRHQPWYPPMLAGKRTEEELTKDTGKKAAREVGRELRAEFWKSKNSVSNAANRSS